MSGQLKRWRRMSSDLGTRIELGGKGVAVGVGYGRSLGRKSADVVVQEAQQATEGIGARLARVQSCLQVCALVHRGAYARGQ